MLIQLLLAHTAQFALNVFMAFVFFAAGLLYFDSWRVDTHKKTPLLRSFGFFLLALVAAFHASSLTIPQLELAAQCVKVFGLILILISLISEPILHPPRDEKGNSPAGRSALWVPFVLPVVTTALIPLSAALLLVIAASYFRKATEGFEKQLKPAFFAFLFLGFAEIVHISFFFSDTPIVFWSKMLSEFGPIWIVQSTFEFIGISILAVWIWGYIRFRLQLQLFVSTIALSLILFLTTTTFYTFLLLNNLENDALIHLKTDVNVLQYALESIKERTLAYAQVVAHDPSLTQAFIQNDKEQLYNLASSYMLAQKTNSLLIASVSGEVAMRAEDADRTNDFVGDDSILKSTREGREMTTVAYDGGITVPEISVKAAVPIRVGGTSGQVVGVAITSLAIDTPFVDRVKAVTGLDVTVFGSDKRAATTFIAPDGKSRFVGTLETNKKVLNTVLSNGEVYVGKSNVLNLPFYTAYAPLKNQENEILGMLFVGKLQNTLTDTAKKSIELTFLGSIILMVLSLIPAYLFSRFLKEQVEA